MAKKNRKSRRKTKKKSGQTSRKQTTKNTKQDTQQKPSNISNIPPAHEAVEDAFDNFRSVPSRRPQQNLRGNDKAYKIFENAMVEAFKKDYKPSILTHEINPTQMYNERHLDVPYIETDVDITNAGGNTTLNEIIAKNSDDPNQSSVRDPDAMTPEDSERVTEKAEELTKKYNQNRAQGTAKIPGYKTADNVKLITPGSNPDIITPEDIEETLNQAGFSADHTTINTIQGILEAGQSYQLNNTDFYLKYDQGQIIAVDEEGNILDLSKDQGLIPIETHPAPTPQDSVSKLWAKIQEGNTSQGDISTLIASLPIPTPVPPKTPQTNIKTMYVPISSMEDDNYKIKLAQLKSSGNILEKLIDKNFDFTPTNDEDIDIKVAYMLAHPIRKGSADDNFKPEAEKLLKDLKDYKNTEVKKRLMSLKNEVKNFLKEEYSFEPEDPSFDIKEEFKDVLDKSWKNIIKSPLSTPYEVLEFINNELVSMAEDRLGRYKIWYEYANKDEYEVNSTEEIIEINHITKVEENIETLIQKYSKNDAKPEENAPIYERLVFMLTEAKRKGVASKDYNDNAKDVITELYNDYKAKIEKSLDGVDHIVATTLELANIATALKSKNKFTAHSITPNGNFNELCRRIYNNKDTYAPLMELATNITAYLGKHVDDTYKIKMKEIKRINDEENKYLLKKANEAVERWFAKDSA